MSIPQFDARLGGKVFLEIKEGSDKTRIKFQFPPKITSDSKSAQWKEVNYHGEEPIAIFMGGQPRTIAMDWTYIVTGEYTGFRRWDIPTISNYVKAMRGYGYKVITSKNAILDYYAYNVVGPGTSEKWTFRIESINVTHSDTIIQDGAGHAYPLKTDIKTVLKFFVNGTAKEAEQAITDADADNKKENPVNIKGLKPIPHEIKWY